MLILAELEALRYSHSRRRHAARTLERLLIYMREAHSITDWRPVHESQLRDFALYRDASSLTEGPKNLSSHAAPVAFDHSLVLRLAAPQRPLAAQSCGAVSVASEGTTVAPSAQRIRHRSSHRKSGHYHCARHRDRALVETLCATGIRRREAHKLDLYDIDTAAHRLAVRLGKGQRDRLVPLTETAAYWLTRYVTAARPELAAGLWWGKGKRHGQPKLIPPTAALWLSVTGRRLSYQMIAERIRNYALQAGVKAAVRYVRLIDKYIDHQACLAPIAAGRIRGIQPMFNPQPLHYRPLESRANLFAD